MLTESQKYWMEFTEEAYRVGLEAYIKVAEENLPAKLQEQALVDYFAAHSEEVSKRYNKKIDMRLQKPYTGTQCRLYGMPGIYGAITLDHMNPLVHSCNHAGCGSARLWQPLERYCNS